MKIIRLMILAIGLMITMLPIAFNAQTQLLNQSNELINFYYNSPQGIGDLQKYYQGDLGAASSDLIVKAVDIDKDGKTEYFVKRKSFCNNQDCMVTLYKQTDNTFTEILSAKNLDVEKVEGREMNSLMSCTTDSSGLRGQCTYYKWNNNQYVVYKCMKAESVKSKFKARIVPCSKLDSADENKSTGGE
jgi:hypothetical protein